MWNSIKMELDFNGKEQERFAAILTSTISSLCKNGMINSTVARVDGLLGITLSNNVVFLVNIRETLCEAEINKKPQEWNQPAIDDIGRNVVEEGSHMCLDGSQQNFVITQSEWHDDDDSSYNSEAPPVARGTVTTDDGSMGQPSCSSNSDPSYRLRKRKKTSHRKSDQRVLNDLTVKVSSFHCDSNVNAVGQLPDQTVNSCGKEETVVVKRECVSEEEEEDATNDYNSSYFIPLPQEEYNDIKEVCNRTSSSEFSVVSPVAAYRSMANETVLSQSGTIVRRLAIKGKQRSGCSYKQYDKEAMRNAVRDVKNGTLNITQASKLFGVPSSTLRYMAKKSKRFESCKKNTTLNCAPIDLLQKLI